MAVTISAMVAPPANASCWTPRLPETWIVTVLVAEATSKSEQVRGEGDGERNRIFADAFGKDVDFFTFYRSMQAYEAGMRHNDTRMVLSPDSEFFRYFVDPSGKTRDKPQAAPAPAR